MLAHGQAGVRIVSDGTPAIEEHERSLGAGKTLPFSRQAGVFRGAGASYRRRGVIRARRHALGLVPLGHSAAARIGASTPSDSSFGTNGTIRQRRRGESKGRQEASAIRRSSSEESAS